MAEHVYQDLKPAPMIHRLLQENAIVLLNIIQSDREVTYDDTDCPFSSQTVTENIANGLSYLLALVKSFGIFQWALSATHDSMENNSCVFREY